MNLHEQARAEAEKRWPIPRTSMASGFVPEGKRDAFVEGAQWAAARTRVVTTVTELDALPVGSVVLNVHGTAFVRVRADVPDFQWAASGHPGYWTASAILGEPAQPARVLYDPEEDR